MWPSLLRKQQPSDKARELWSEKRLSKFGKSMQKLRKDIENEVSDTSHDEQQIKQCIDQLKNYCMTTLDKLNQNCTRESYKKFTEPLLGQTKVFFRCIKELKSVQKLEREDCKRLSSYIKLLHNKKLYYSSEPKYKIHESFQIHPELLRDKHSEMSVMKMIDKDEALENKLRAGTLKLEHLKNKAIKHIKTFEEELPESKIPAMVIKDFNHDMLGFYQFFDVVLENESEWIKRFINLIKDDRSELFNEILKKSEMLRRIVSNISRN